MTAHADDGTQGPEGQKGEGHEIGQGRLHAVHAAHEEVPHLVSQEDPDDRRGIAGGAAQIRGMPPAAGRIEVEPWTFRAADRDGAPLNLGAAATEVHVFAEVAPPRLRIGKDLGGRTVTEDLTRANHVAPVGDLKGLADLVIGDQDRDPFGPQLADDLPGFLVRGEALHDPVRDIDEVRGLIVSGRVISLIAAMLAIGLGWLVAYRAWGRRTGDLFIMLAAWVPLDLQQSHFATVEAHHAGWVMAALAACFWLARSGRPVAAAVSGLTIGASLAVKVASLALGLPLVVAVLIAVRGREMLAALRLLAVAGATGIAGFWLCQPWAFVHGRPPFSIVVTALIAAALIELGSHKVGSTRSVLVISALLIAAVSALQVVALVGVAGDSFVSKLGSTVLVGAALNPSYLEGVGNEVANQVHVVSNVVLGSTMGLDIGCGNYNLIHNNLITNNFQGLYFYGGSAGGSYGGPYAIPAGSVEQATGLHAIRLIHQNLAGALEAVIGAVFGERKNFHFKLAACLLVKNDPLIFSLCHL